ncbi:hypothetical protein [Micromonospora inositola]|uniref:DUF1440 domain-containing protein n=1 Tax=Micromonospora inositola TaxID=47865 RepID=A0A1C5JLK4_9ACTN|nr:hypothetical protein [Micromonospora inositola]SCG71450.1 hypothetical protein GA0070613_4919 [Micromonospora inositola]
MRVAPLVDGAIAGAVGSAALNVVGYLDIAVRARPASSTAEETIRRLAGAAHVDLGPEDRAATRRSGLGPVLGYATGVAAGAAFGLLAARRRIPLPLAAGLLGGGVMATTDGSITALGVSNPRTWRPKDWVADIIPHLAYGMATAATWNRLRSPSRRGR